MKGPSGTKLAMPFHPLYTPLGLSPGGTDHKMAYQVKGLLYVEVLQGVNHFPCVEHYVQYFVKQTGAWE